MTASKVKKNPHGIRRVRAQEAPLARACSPRHGADKGTQELLIGESLQIRQLRPAKQARSYL